MNKFIPRDKPDANKAAICSEVRACGYEVIETKQPVDILVVDSNLTFLCNITDNHNCDR